MMLKQLVRQVITLQVLAIFLLGSGGIQVYQHFCACESSAQATLFLPEEPSCCGSDDGTPVSAGHCCAADKEDKQSHDCGSENSCCHTASYFIKIDDVFVHSLSQEKSSHPEKIPVFALADDHEEIHESEEFLVRGRDTAYSRSLSGKNLLIVLQQLKIPVHMVA